MKSKEYNFFRLTVFVLVVLIFNSAILISDGIMYIIWFVISILSLVSVFIIEGKDIISLLKQPSEIKISRKAIFLLAFLLTYRDHYHYQALKDIGYFIIALLQLLNFTLFVLVFCIERKVVSDDDNG